VTYLKILFGALPILVMCGCASLPLNAAGTDSSSPSTSVADADQMNLGALKNAELPKGECGMILWTLDANRPAPVLRYLSGGDAEIVLGGDRMKFVLDKANGASGFGVYEELDFRNDTGKRLLVRIRFGLGFDGGSYLNRGIVTLESPDGWLSVTPAAGIAGCRAK